MKKILFILTTIIALMSSCVASQITLLTKNGEKLNVVPTMIGNDTIYYHFVEDQTDKKLILSDSLYSIHTSEILAGLNYKNKLVEPYYIEFPVLAEDTIVDTNGSSLAIRCNKKGKSEYVLSLSADENYVIPSKQLASFYQRHSPESYTLHKKGKVLCNAAWGMLGGSIPLLIGGIAMTVLGSKQLVGYEQVKGSYGPPHYKPIYERNNAMYFSGWAMYIAWFACDIASSVLITRGAQKQQEALDIYHIQAQQATPKLSLNTQISNNGIGIALQF